MSEKVGIMLSKVRTMFNNVSVMLNKSWEYTKTKMRQWRTRSGQCWTKLGQCWTTLGQMLNNVGTMFDNTGAMLNKVDKRKCLEQYWRFDNIGQGGDNVEQYPYDALSNWISKRIERGAVETISFRSPRSKNSVRHDEWRLDQGQNPEVRQVESRRLGGRCLELKNDEDSWRG